MSWRDWRPWARQTEVRESSYTDLLVARALERAGGAAIAAPTATGALESAAGLVARCFAVASVEGAERFPGAVTPAVLSTIGRALVRSGELVAAVEVHMAGRVRLRPASDWDVTGDFDPETWRYRVNLAAPSVTVTRMLPAASVIHARYQVDPARPWHGIGPLESAALAGRLSAETVTALGDEMSGPRGGLLPTPGDGQDPTMTALRGDIRTLRGKVALVESVETMHPGAAAGAPAGDWTVKRIGADPPASEVQLLERSSLEVLAAVGVPPALFAIGEGTAQRDRSGASCTAHCSPWAPWSRPSCRRSWRPRSASTSTRCSRRTWPAGRGRSSP